MEELVKRLVGLRLADAQDICKKKGLRHRLVSMDGKAFGVTDDFNPYRVNFHVEKEVVTKITFE
jgi:hypothetical protein